jgi:deoxyribodipyrimidine photo-lyase
VYKTAIVLFHRDLRLNDNNALNTALRRANRVYPCYILDKTLLSQLDGKLPRVQYLLRALQELDDSLRKQGSQLHVIYAKPDVGLLQLQKIFDADAIFFHRDVGKYANHRDELLQTHCEKMNISCNILNDVTLHPPEKTVKADGTPYTVFTPFFRRAFQLSVPKPETLTTDNLARITTNHFSLSNALLEAGLSVDDLLSPTADAHTALKNASELTNYSLTRDIPSLAGTSRLSAALRFGIVSTREVWWAIANSLGNEHPLLRQLYWRDFFFSIALYFPRVFNGCFHQKYNAIIWQNKQNWIDAWKTGHTGFPIVDAGMRELRTTGYMHNRVRMIVASFLVKDLHCDWRIGERHFAELLIDYDPCINNGNWQWAASTGCDAQPYFRIFNPWTQQQKFDPECIYIKRWLPELNNIPTKTLHNLFKLEQALPGYVLPVIDHSIQSTISKTLFSEAGKSWQP